MHGACLYGTFREMVVKDKYIELVLSKHKEKLKKVVTRAKLSDQRKIDKSAHKKNSKKPRIIE